ncbi:replication protein [Halopseudomonas oceani]|uniref:replication protein n=1 Tax=Halopseudomonas oceani TaxID=1708783 RepID=UPI002AA73D1F|nr:replication protein [Halopseudomonas oceani]
MRSELLLATGAMEAGFVHACGTSGYFSLLMQGERGKQQSSHLVRDMDRILRNSDPTIETWISQNQFTRPNRRAVNLGSIGSLFADLDTYRQHWAAGKAPEQLADEVLNFCVQEGLPTPSLLIYSGRGIQAKWLLTNGLTRAGLPRWNACQRSLGQALSYLGSDQRAQDVSRVLRLVSTVNSKSGQICRVVHVEHGSGGQPRRYDFDHLEKALPSLSPEVGRQHVVRQKPPQIELSAGGARSGLHRTSGKNLAWDRLEDLRALVQMRGGLREGERMTFLFWSLNFLLLSGVVKSSGMHLEAEAIVRELAPGWADYRREELATLYSKAKRFEAGEVVEFGKQKHSPLYTPRNDTLINLFQITDEEQRQLRTIISHDIKKERNRARSAARRKAAGAVSREEYLALSNEKRRKSKELSAQGLTRAAIAERLDISRSAVDRYLTQR